MTIAFYLCINMTALIFMMLSQKYAYNSNTKQHSMLNLKKSTFFVGCSFLILFLTLALRDHVGKDYESYADAYLRLNNGTLTEVKKRWLSMGYKILCHIIGFLAPENYILMFAIVGFVTLYYFYRSICTLSQSRTWSLYILICFCLYYQCFNQIRQMLAIAITLYAIRYIKENNPVKYFLYIAIAMFLHTSAVVMSGLWIVRNWKINFKNILFYGIAAIIGYVGFDIIVTILSYTNYGATYLNWAKYNTSYETSSILNLIVRLLLLVGCLIFSKETTRRAPYTISLYNSVIICTVLQVLTIRSYLFGRVTTYFFVPYIFLIPEVLYTCKTHLRQYSKHLMSLFTFLLLAAYHFVYYYSSSGAVGSGYEIYRTFLLK